MSDDFGDSDFGDSLRGPGRNLTERDDELIEVASLLKRATSRSSSERKGDSEDQVGLFGVGTGAPPPPEPLCVSAIAISANQRRTAMTSPLMAGPRAS